MVWRIPKSKGVFSFGFKNCIDIVTFNICSQLLHESISFSIFKLELYEIDHTMEKPITSKLRLEKIKSSDSHWNLISFPWCY